MYMISPVCICTGREVDRPAGRQVDIHQKLKVDILPGLECI